MNKGILALYDTTEIQGYIYSSSKLQDNIGASELVDKCFKDFLVSVIRDYGKENGITVKTNWEENEEWNFKEDIKIEVVYVGGGNALVAFRNEDIWKDINYIFGKKLLIEARGLNFVTVATDIKDSFKEDLDILFVKINNKKYSYKKIEGVKGISITKECSITKNVANGKDKKGLPISYEIKRKRENTIVDGGYREIDALAGEKGEGFVAVVHIDGNNMGKKVEEIVSKTSNYKDAIHHLRDFSKNISHAYENAYQNVCKEFNRVIFNSGKSDDLTKRYNKMFRCGEAPFRKILIKGDDVTYICYGKIAISSLEKYFEFLKVELDKHENTKGLSACGGIAIVKPHFPFADAYKIAEECCGNAKLKAKSVRKPGNAIGNYFDFHIVRGAVLGSLGEMRSSQYQSTTEGGESLLQRPFTLDNEKKSVVFNDVKELVSQLKNAKMPRNKVKELRDSFIYGTEELVVTISKIQSRGINFTYKGEEILKGNTTEGVCLESPLYDAIDFMELYDDLFENKES